MLYNRRDYTNDTLLMLYRHMLLPRMIEEKMLLLLRQGKVSKWFSGIGQEAISAGAIAALAPDEWVMPLHRNLAVFTGRGMPLHKLYRQWQGQKEGYSKGRERSFHFGSRAHHICGMISHLGPQLTLANGAALAHQLRGERKVALAFTGDGGTSEGDFHEALNVAAVWGLPVIFIIENNGYGLSTPVSEQYRCHSLVHRARGYGMDGVQIDGNNILTVYDTIRGVREYCLREQKPYLIECMTFRMRGHEEASGTKYVPQELFEAWGKKDPVENFGFYLENTGVLSPEAHIALRQELKTYIETELSLAQDTTEMIPDEAEELADVYAPAPPPPALAQKTPAPVQPRFAKPAAAPVQEDYPSLLPEGSGDVRFMDALRDALHQSMHRYPELVLMGQDIAEYGGAFKITEGFMDAFGKSRVRNTPLCESAILGAALGLSLEGYKSMVEMQFADFVSVGFNQIVNNLAKLHYRWGQKADVVVRMPTGAGVGAGPFHSQSNEAWFTHTPGLRVVYPATPYDAKGLLNSAFNDPNPVIYMEHKGLYRSLSGPVPGYYYTVPIGEARVVQSGSDATIITYGMGVHWATEYAQRHPQHSLYILDLRSLAPLDYAAIRSAVAATGKVMLLHEDTLTGGLGGEVAAWIAEHCFSLLDAPIVRCASLDTPIPFNLALEQQFLANSRLASAMEKLMAY